MNYEAEFHSLLNVFASNSKTQISQTLLRVYDVAVYPFGYKRACIALETLMLETKFWSMPTPRMIIDAIENKASPMSKANLIAGKIIEAVGKFGYSNSIDAKEFIGPDGWLAVTSFGGWSYLCSNLGLNMNPSSTRAQLRDYILSELGVTKKDVEALPLLESGSQFDRLESVAINCKMKEIPK